MIRILKDKKGIAMATTVIAMTVIVLLMSLIMMLTTINNTTINKSVARFEEKLELDQIGYDFVSLNNDFLSYYTLLKGYTVNVETSRAESDKYELYVTTIDLTSKLTVFDKLNNQVLTVGILQNASIWEVQYWNY